MARFGRRKPFLPILKRPELGPVYFDNKSTSGYVALNNSPSWSHVIGTNSNRLIVVGVSIFTGNTVTSATCGAVSLTKLRADGSTLRSEIWYGVAPSSGSQTITVNISAGIAAVIMSSVSYWNVDQTTPFDANDGSTGSGTPASDSITTGSANERVFGNLTAQTTSSITAELGQSDRYLTSSGSGTAAVSEKGIILTASATTFQWNNIGVIDQWSISMGAIKPYSSSVTTTQTITGISRIEKSVSQTITGLARIQKNVSQTITGVSRIQKTVSQTITGLARITADVTKTTTGVARIQNSTSGTITGVARIQKSVSQTITGVSRIQAAASSNNTGVSRIQKPVSKTTTGKARIQTTSGIFDGIIFGVSRIRKSVTQTISGVGRIQKSSTQTISGVSNITTPVGVSTQTIMGVARIFGTSLQTIVGKARIVRDGFWYSQNDVTFQQKSTTTWEEDDTMMFHTKNMSNWYESNEDTWENAN